MKKEKTNIEIECQKQLKKVGTILFTEMHMQRMTTYELSEKSGVSRPTIANVFNGEGCQISNYVAVCLALKKNPFFILSHES